MPLKLGRLLREHGNHVFDVYKGAGRPTIFSFPVKHQWHERASLALIRRSAKELLAFMDLGTWESAALPRPGCGNGRLDWETVRPVLEEFLDDRFTVYSQPPGLTQVPNGETRERGRGGETVILLECAACERAARKHGRCETDRLFAVVDTVKVPRIGEVQPNQHNERAAICLGCGAVYRLTTAPDGLNQLALLKEGRA
jgi:hypothetical protein